MNFFSTFSSKHLEVIKKAVSLQRFREIRRTKLTEVMKGRLAQLVQSICLTSRGSAVRIRQRPLLLRRSNHENLYMVAFFIYPTNTKEPLLNPYYLFGKNNTRKPDGTIAPSGFLIIKNSFQQPIRSIIFIRVEKKHSAPFLSISPYCLSVWQLLSFCRERTYPARQYT